LEPPLLQKSVNGSEIVEIKGILKSSGEAPSNAGASLQIEHQHSLDASKSQGKKSKKSTERDGSKKSSRSRKQSKRSSRQVSKLESKLSHFSKTSEP